MKTKKIAVSEIKLNPSNPRTIKDDKFQKLVKSIKEFPEMLELRPIVVNAEMFVLGGNMRLRACQDAGLEEVPVVIAEELTPEQQKQFIIKDNIGYGEWDWDIIADQWNEQELVEWGLDVAGFNLNADFNETDEYNYLNKVTIQFKTFEEAMAYHEKCIKENLKAQLS
jgi:ParB-like chromosome segregation protein Spo0J